MIKNYLLIAWIAIGILSIWMIMGFLVPMFIFGGVNDGGKFGDSFGAVNSLFSGLGFLGLIYTINLQISYNQELKKQEKFSLYLKLLDQIKLDLSTVERGSFKGIQVWRNIALHFKGQPDSVRPELEYLFGINTQFILLFDMLKKEMLIDNEEIKLLKIKLLLTFSSNIGTITGQIVNDLDENVTHETQKNIFLSSRQLVNIIREEFPEGSVK